MLKLGRVIFLKSLSIRPLKTVSQCFYFCGCLVILVFFPQFLFSIGGCVQECQFLSCPVACRIMALKAWEKQSADCGPLASGHRGALQTAEENPSCRSHTVIWRSNFESNLKNKTKQKPTLFLILFQTNFLKVEPHKQVILD